MGYPFFDAVSFLKLRRTNRNPEETRRRPGARAKTQSPRNEHGEKNIGPPHSPTHPPHTKVIMTLQMFTKPGAGSGISRVKKCSKPELGCGISRDSKCSSHPPLCPIDVSRELKCRRDELHRFRRGRTQPASAAKRLASADILRSSRSLELGGCRVSRARRSGDLGGE